MAQILNTDDSPGCTILGLGEEHRYQLQHPGSKGFAWDVAPGLTVLSDGRDSWITIKAPTIASKLNEFHLAACTGTGPSRTRMAEIQITVVDVVNIKASLTPSPSLRRTNRAILEKVNRRAEVANHTNPPGEQVILVDVERAMEPFVSHLPLIPFPTFQENDAPDAVLALLKAPAPVSQRLQATIRPDTVKLDWAIARNRDDHKSLEALGMPQITTMSSDTKVATLSQNSTGAFIVTASPRCACGKAHSTVGRALKFVLLEVRKASDQSHARTDYFYAQNDGLERDADRASWIRGADFDAVLFKTTFTLLSGGPKADLYLADDSNPIVQGGWLNNELQTPDPSGSKTQVSYDTRASYRNATGGKTAEMMYWPSLDPVSPHRRFRKPGVPGSWPTQGMPPEDDVVRRPILDAATVELTDALRGALCLGQATSSKAPSADGLGFTFTMTAADLPNLPLPLALPPVPHIWDRPGPNDYNPWTDVGDDGFWMHSLEVDLRYRAAAYFNTRSAKWTFGVALARNWAITAKWDVNQDTGNDGNRGFSATVMRGASPPKVSLGPETDYLTTRGGLIDPATAGIEVWEPTSLACLHQCVKIH